MKALLITSLVIMTILEVALFVASIMSILFDDDSDTLHGLCFAAGCFGVVIVALVLSLQRLP